MSQSADTGPDKSGGGRVSSRGVMSAEDDPDLLRTISRDVRLAARCPVCYGTAAITAHDGARTCDNGHAVCGPCARRLAAADRGDACPTCRAPFAGAAVDSATVRLLRRAHRAVTVACAHRVHGCRTVSLLTDIDQHEALCEHPPDPGEDGGRRALGPGTGEH